MPIVRSADHIFEFPRQRRRSTHTDTTCATVKRRDPLTMDLISVFSIKFVPEPGLEEVGNCEAVCPPKVPHKCHKCRLTHPKCGLKRQKCELTEKLDFFLIIYDVNP